jgi:lipoyl(octanoyl) transferase
VRIARWITSHGFAFNVTTNLDHFNLIVPCGITEADKGVTSLERLLGRSVPMAEVEDNAITAMAEVFDRQVLSGSSRTTPRLLLKS